MWLSLASLLVDAILHRSFKQYPAEGAAEVLVEYGVYERIQRRIHVAEPESDHEGLRGYLKLGEEGLDDVKDKEGQPASDEAAHYEAQDQGCAFLLLSRQSPLLSLRIARLRRLGVAAA